MIIISGWSECSCLVDSVEQFETHFKTIKKVKDYYIEELSDFIVEYHPMISIRITFIKVTGNQSEGRKYVEGLIEKLNIELSLK